MSDLKKLNNVYFSYDKEHDVLYVYFGDPKPSYSEETEPGVYISFSEENDILTGIIIIDYKKKLRPNLASIIPANLNLKQINKYIQ